MARNTALRSSQIEEEAITEPKLDIVNSPTNNYVLSWNTSEGKFEWASAGAGDMLKSTYDTDDDGIVDKAETLTDGGTGNEVTYAEAQDAVDKAHTQNTDTALGAQSEDLDMNTHKITGVVDPVSDQDAATKKYVGDNSINNIVEDTTPQLGGELDSQAHSIGFTQQTATGNGTTTIDWKLGNKFYFTFGAQNDTFTFTAPSKPCNLILVLKQDGTGSRTATWPVSVKWAGKVAPTLTTDGNAVDIVSFYYDGTNYHGVASLDFAVPA